MVDWLGVMFNLLALIPIAAIGAGIVFAGYYAYKARIERETVARMPPVVDPAEALPRLREEVRNNLAEGRVLLERTRDAVRKGTKG